MHGDYIEMAIIAFILLGIGYSAFKGGAANPVGTATLERRINGISNKVSTLSSRIETIESDTKEIKQEAVTSQDFERLAGQMATVRAEMAGDRKMAERTQHSLDRIERLILEKGLGK